MTALPQRYQKPAEPCSVLCAGAAAQVLADPHSRSAPGRAAPRPPRGRGSPPRGGPSPATFFSRLGLRSAAGQGQHFSRPTATYCPQRGTAAWALRASGKRPGRSLGVQRSPCLSPSFQCVLGTALQWCENNSARPNEVLVPWLTPLLG